MSKVPRVAILPREVASEVMTSAVARGSLAVAAALILLDVPVLIDLFIERHLVAHLALPLAALLVMVALLALYAQLPSAGTRLLYLLGGAACAFLYQVAVAEADRALVAEGTYAFNRPVVALVLIAPLVLRPIWGVVWATAGVLIGVGVTGAASLYVGSHLPIGWGSLASWIICVSVYAALSAVRARQASTAPDLVALETETRRLDLQDQFEQRAAAMIHDTVLSDLSAIMASNGPIDDRARDRFRADVATLAEPSWLHAPATSLEVDSSDVALRNGLIALVSEFQWKGLTVDITGDDYEIIPLEPAAITAVLGAVGACLENVLLHSGTRSAELVLGPGETEVTFMVIDHGVGFDPDAVAPDRLGLRTSVVQRVAPFGGDVRIWSRPDSGTSIIIRFPVSSVSRARPASGINRSEVTNDGL